MDLAAEPQLVVGTDDARECTVGKHTHCSQESQQDMLGVDLLLAQETCLLQGALEGHLHGPRKPRRPGGPFLARRALPSGMSDRLLGPQTKVPECQRSDPISFCQ